MQLVYNDFLQVVPVCSNHSAVYLCRLVAAAGETSGRGTHVELKVRNFELSETVSRDTLTADATTTTTAAGKKDEQLSVGWR